MKAKPSMVDAPSCSEHEAASDDDDHEQDEDFFLSLDFKALSCHGLIAPVVGIDLSHITRYGSSTIIDMCNIKHLA